MTQHESSKVLLLSCWYTLRLRREKRREKEWTESRLIIRLTFLQSCTCGLSTWLWNFIGNSQNNSEVENNKVHVYKTGLDGFSWSLLNQEQGLGSGVYYGWQEEVRSQSESDWEHTYKWADWQNGQWSAGRNTEVVIARVPIVRSSWLQACGALVDLAWTITGEGVGRFNCGIVFWMGNTQKSRVYVIKREIIYMWQTRGLVEFLD